ncbi:MAG: 6-carboxytetrahydropterin synthase QueD [Cyclobacteriaceae bacterium]
MLIFKKFTFDSAHALPNVPTGHKCKAVHGHTYQLTIFIEGDLVPELEWVEDFAVVKKVVSPIIDEVDHKYLNDIEGLENPTCERIAIWLWDRIKEGIPALKRIELNETPTSGVIYEG